MSDEVIGAVPGLLPEDLEVIERDSKRVVVRRKGDRTGTYAIVRSDEWYRFFVDGRERRGIPLDGTAEEVVEAFLDQTGLR